MNWPQQGPVFYLRNLTAYLVQCSHVQAKAVLVASASAPGREHRKNPINTNMLRNVERACCCCNPLW
jgi:hypothetical protein